MRKSLKTHTTSRTGTRPWLTALAVAGILLAASALPACAQVPSGYVQTTATVPALARFSFGAAWTNLSSSSQLGLLGCVSTFQTTVNGTFDSYGHFSTLLADTSQICPAPSTWTFTISCPSGTTGGFQVQAAVTGGGGSADISAQITAVLPANPCTAGGGGGGGGGGGIPGGSNTDVQVNVNGFFGGYDTLTYTPTAGLDIGGIIVGHYVTIGPQSTPPANWVFDLTTPATALASIGGGTVTSFAAPSASWPTWLVPTVTNLTTTPSLAVTPATGQTSHKVIGTCGTATSFGPCSLVAADLPTIPNTQVSGLGTASTHAAGDFEPALGNPSTNGYVLSSTTVGVRSWTANAVAASVQKNCLGGSAVCAGTTTGYVLGTTYTNSSGIPVLEEVTAGYTTYGTTGCDESLVAVINGVQGPINGVHNACGGRFSVTFLVPAGATFSATLSNDNGNSTPYAVINWLEVSL